MVDTPLTANIFSLSHLGVALGSCYGSLVVECQGLHVTWGLILGLERPQPCLRCHRLRLLPVDKVLILVALHLILNGCL